MPPLGAHQSIAGGYHKAVEAAVARGCQCVQLFTRNTNQWRAKLITPAAAEQFRTAIAQAGLRHTLAHDSYLINLASPERTLWRKSIDAFVQELLRAATLGIPCVVTHPGAYTTSSEDAGLRRIAAALDEVHAQTRGVAARCLLETTAGQGTSLGWRFEHLRAILDAVQGPDLLGVCFDTCHVFAAGYPLGPQSDYEATMTHFDRTVGLERIKAFHLNDSRGKLGSRLDRHQHIGRGEMGTEPFRRLLNDPRFAQVPMYLETPKGREGDEDLDVINLRALRGIIHRRLLIG